ncbi:MAG: preprotein translocase subunit YajC [Frankiaceae bacterium]|nr:preprotein translocase subunit YajC [Frankiaceae bacterium]MBV9369894.1 preprotein translocase subunit YajC [Frankiales bacterium]
MLAHHIASTLLAASSSGKNKGSGYGTLVLFALIILAFVVFTRSQRAKQRRVLEQRKSISVGVEVVTTAGLIAHVVEMDDETVTLEIAPGVHSKFLRQAVVRVVEEPVEDTPDTDVPTPDTAPGDTAPGDTAPDRTG